MLPFDPQARHGREVAQEWFLAQRLEAPALSELDRAIRSAVHGFEAHLREFIHSRLSAASKVAIDRLLAGEEVEAGIEEPSANSAGASALSELTVRPNSATTVATTYLIGIAWRQAIDVFGLAADVFQGVPSKFLEQFRQHCATESIRELRRHPAPIRYSMVAMFCWRRRQQLTDGLVVSLRAIALKA